MTDNVLKVTNLTKIFTSWSLKKLKPIKTSFTAVDQLCFEINEGEIIGLLGPNGAGKTTTAQMLIGCLTPTKGKISYFNQPFLNRDPAIMQKLNFASAYSDLPRRMTVEENLDVFARLYQVPNRKKRIQELLTTFEVADLIKKPVASLSSGQKTRVILAKAFINYPRLLLLDEPTASLDPEIAVKVRQFLIKQRDEYGVAMLFTSHNMKEVEDICDRIIFLNHGRKIAEDTPTGLAKRIKKIKLKILVVANQDKAETYLTHKNARFYWKKNHLTINTSDQQLPKIIYRLSEQGVRYKNIEVIRPSLEDFFLKIAKEAKQ
ncbi:ABC transporter ATP-binding protein [Patescibacteria group bacterium]|nr:ABC transporter ATP-binding protein [Patescibacteria group bacterium]MBU1931469.1 ABC transporter ATP-binding protein [Patescibacteria group bacterium]